MCQVLMVQSWDYYTGFVTLYVGFCEKVIAPSDKKQQFTRQSRKTFSSVLNVTFLK